MKELNTDVRPARGEQSPRLILDVCAKLREALKSCVDEMCNRCRELAATRGNPLPCLNGCEPVYKAKLALAASRATAKKSLAVGDCAKLREALKKVAESSAEIMERVRYKDGLAFNTANYIADVARTALAAPPRNCDKFDNLNTAQRYYIERGCPKGLGMIVDGEIHKTPWKSHFEKWLFDKENKAKGENNGSK